MPYSNDFSGVYCLKTLNTKLIYIGSSKGLSRRKALHKSAIKKNDPKRKTKITDAIIAGDTYTFEILELCNNYLEREQYWIDFYKKQDVYKLVNEFNAVRESSDCSQEFKNRMSEIRKEKWKDPIYREQTLKKISATQFTPERLNKPLHYFTESGKYLGILPSAKEASDKAFFSKNTIAAAARGKHNGGFKIGGYIFIYQEIGVLYKLDELLETHPELRAISSQAWEVFNKYHEGSTTNQ